MVDYIPIDSRRQILSLPAQMRMFNGRVPVTHYGLS